MHQPRIIPSLLPADRYMNRFPTLSTFRVDLRVNVERVKHWEGKGAQLSPTVSRLVKQFGKAKKAA